MVIGATIILEPTFPTFIPLSKHLDLSDPYESKVAFAYIKKASEHCLVLYQLLLGIAVPPDVRNVPQVVRMALDLSNNRSLFIKTIDRATYQRGIGLFTGHNHDPTDVDSGIQNMMMVFNKLYNSAARQYVEFPLSIRTPDSASMKLYQIIYRNLSTLGFVIGAPNRMTHEEDYNKYCLSLRRAVHAVHAAGVIHVDLYLSNVMWKKTGDEVEIKIIDWDASQLLSQEDFHPNIKAKLEDHLHLQVTFGPEHDNLYLSILDLERDVYSEHWNQLSSNNKPTIDKAFFSLLNYSLERKDK
jgi:serine/threonine protein kinase